MTIKDGGPAFPLSTVDPFDRSVTTCDGMALRDYFAGLAMQGLLAQSGGTARPSDVGLGAEYAYAMADAMLKAREAETQQEKLLAGYEMGHLQAIAEKARRMNGRME